MVPLNRIGSWRMMDSRDLRVCRGSLEMSMLSITILPVWRKFTKTHWFHQLRHFSSFLLLFQLLFYPLRRHRIPFGLCKKGHLVQKYNVQIYLLWQPLVNNQTAISIILFILFYPVNILLCWCEAEVIFYPQTCPPCGRRPRRRRIYRCRSCHRSPPGKKAKTVIIIITINLSIHSLSSLLVWEACG